MSAGGALQASYLGQVISNAVNAYSLAVQPDGRVIVGRSNGNDPELGLIRLEPNGAIDTTFRADIRSSVFALGLQPDGKILVGGAGARLLRLLPDGSLDPGFAAPHCGQVFAMALQPDGKILIGGAFTSVGGYTRHKIARINPDGEVDVTFATPVDEYVLSLAIQSDGAILVGGQFYYIGNAQQRSHFARLRPDGMVDPGFIAPVDRLVRSIVLQADGKIIICGDFTSVGGEPRKLIARLLPDGSVDPQFDPTKWDSFMNGERAYGVALARDGKVVVLGNFGGFGEHPRSGVARLQAAEPASSELVKVEAAYMWNRGGSSPEVEFAGFRFTTNGNDWSASIPGVRTAGGWRFDGAVVPPLATVMVSGFARGGTDSGSVWPVQEVSGPPVVVRHPENSEVLFGSRASFASVVVGKEPVEYQWLKNGSPLVDDGRITGARTAVFTIANAFVSDRASYTLEITSPDGQLVSRPARLGVLDPYFLSTPSSTVIQEGRPATFQVSAGGSDPLSYQWRHDGDPIPNATSNALTLEGLLIDAGDYDVVVRSGGGSITSSVARLTVQQVVDRLNPDLDAMVYTVALQPDGRILAGGAFTKVGGRPCPPLVRLFPNGVRDSGFAPQFDPGASVLSLAHQLDGKILVGLIDPIGTALVRLNADGSRDTSFARVLTGRAATPAALPRGIYALSPLSNGQLLVAGNFTQVDGQNRSHLIRLNGDGSVDTSFNPAPDSPVTLLLVEADGRIVTSGFFTSIGGQYRRFLARLRSDGIADPAFDPSPDLPAYALASQADNRIVVGGAFNSMAGTRSIRMARLSADGSLDATFGAWCDSEPYQVTRLVEGNFLIAGRFQVISYQPQKWLVRMYPDGAVNTNFNPTLFDKDIPRSEGNTYQRLIDCFAIQPDGKILSGGAFVTLGGFPAVNLGRAFPPSDHPVTESLTTVGSTATWLRSGPLPEFDWTVFESSADGVIWSPRIMGGRISGGWQATGLNLSTGSRVRARGYVSGGARNGSAWFYERRTGPPVLLEALGTRVLKSGESVTLFASAAGEGPLTFQWLKNGQPLADSATISGSRSATLTLAQVVGLNSGAYAVIVSNAIGTVTSDPGLVLVGEPVILTQPTNTQAVEGQFASFTVAALGTPPKSYQWRQNGMDVPLATAATLSWDRVSVGQAGLYDVIVTSAFGSITSSVARLKVFTRPIPDNFNPMADGYVGAFAEQPDGRILVGGGFTRIGGVSRPFVARLNPDGEPDPTFNPAPDDAVLALAIQTDGRMVLAGQFANVAGQSRRFLARLHPDGRLDEDFRPEPDWVVSTLALQPDGRIVIGGEFTAVGSVRRGCLARLLADGSVDESFNPEVDGYVRVVAMQPDGRILVGGDFNKLGGQNQAFFGRLESSGAWDNSFRPLADGAVYAIAVEADGRLVAGGTAWSGPTIHRFGADGARDADFQWHAPNGEVYAISLQSDGRILFGGDFNLVRGVPRVGLARLNRDGSLDTGFNPGARGSVYALVPQSDSRILVGGDFFTLGAQTRHGIGRLANSEPAEQSLIHTASKITWWRGATTPEVWRTTFELTTDGTTWTALGAGTRTTEGWQLDGLQLPANASLRARGYIQTGSAWFVQALEIHASLMQPPRIAIQPQGVVAEGRLQLQLISTPGVRLELQARTGFESGAWVPIQVINNTSGTAFIMESIGSNPRRFYRVQQLP